ncbi:hypothetical protein HL033_03395 [Neoehrlichia mikurensis]|uniref:Uncharacterized protein n=1 Tax=Neoehrlichia mikurensis TaxID=89586 RepID=A0A9Q9C120_9RICK|nr:hypothetical protein [Neoehrlichia mikurensis]QXK91781.1 hypothetical protein IAH97_03390 [Neoehrlichia mikurensis]QXK93471.1 hypothetical protein HL033_03395 [Neoehrlichia mikurensis]UTO55574.1 hypothetical protein LUA82_00560 [Neoehrlichia mikurensis]UTO56495.1 hypothetical protein LUA81_00560 [Neoehrlichia mikurensis]
MLANQFKNSILCSFKGACVFSMASLTAIQYSMFIKLFNIQDSKKYTDERSYAIVQTKKSIIPLCELLIIMPIVFLSHHVIHSYLHINLAPLLSYSLCIGICIAIMIATCFILRRLGIVSDCCNPIVHPIYDDSIFIKFSPEKKSDDYNKDIESTNVESTTDQNLDIISSLKSYPYLKLYLFTLLMLPIKILLLPMMLSLAILNIIEIPFSFILDMIEYSKFSKEGNRFCASKENLVLSKSFFLAFLKDIALVLTLGASEIIILKNKKSPSHIVNVDAEIKKSCFCNSEKNIIN